MCEINKYNASIFCLYLPKHPSFDFQLVCVSYVFLLWRLHQKLASSFSEFQLAAALSIFNMISPSFLAVHRN